MEKKLIELLPEICKRLDLITEYDLCRTTESEMIYLLAQKLNDLMVKHNDDMVKVNDKFIQYDDKLRYLLGDGLVNEIKKLLAKMYADGVLQQLVEGAMVDINKKLNDNKKAIQDNTNEIERINNLTINVKNFGAKGDGITDDTQAFKKALDKIGNTSYKSGGGKIIIPAGTYILREPLYITDQVTLQGDGKELTILKPRGIFNCINVVGDSFQIFRNGITLKDFLIDGSELTGKGLYLKYMALNSLISGVNILNCKDDGVYIEGCFDFIFENSEIRNCKNYGIHVYEINSFSVEGGGYEEVSYITFNNVMCIHNNFNNTDKIQWRFDGTDNIFMNDCKANEGLIGVWLDKGCHKMTISNLYMDGLEGSTSDGTKAQMFRINHEWCNAITIRNANGWNCALGVNAKRGRDIILEEIRISDGNNVIADKELRCWNTIDGPISCKDMSKVQADSLGFVKTNLCMSDIADVKVKYVESTVTIDAYTGSKDKTVIIPQAKKILHTTVQILGKNYLARHSDGGDKWLDLMLYVDNEVGNTITVTGKALGNQAIQEATTIKFSSIVYYL